MHNHDSRIGIRLSHLIPVMMISLISVSLAKPFLAQQPGRRNVDRRESPAARTLQDKRKRQLAAMERRSLENAGKTKPAERSSERLLYEQISEDFQRLQVINNEMMRATFPSDSANSPDALNYKQISEALAQIHNRASRLKSNLRLPKSEEEQQKPSNPDISNISQLKTSLVALDTLIMSFIENPMFKNPGVVDVDHSAKARRDLEGIIELSRTIKRKAEKLRN